MGGHKFAPPPVARQHCSKKVLEKNGKLEDPELFPGFITAGDALRAIVLCTWVFFLAPASN